MTSDLQSITTQHRKAEHDIEAAFLNRWSPRAFKEDPVPDSELLRIFEAARWAPSGGNLQPWRFIIARTPEDREKFVSFLSPFNAEWASKAPVLALIVAHTLTAGGNPNRTNGFDAGAAWGYLALQASKQGIITHAMGGFDPDKARAALNIPSDYELYAVVAIGYQGDIADLSEKNQEREKPSGRRQVHESMFEGSFGQPLNG